MRTARYRLRLVLAFFMLMDLETFGVAASFVSELPWPRLLREFDPDSANEVDIILLFVCLLSSFIVLTANRSL